MVFQFLFYKNLLQYYKINNKTIDYVTMLYYVCKKRQVHTCVLVFPEMAIIIIFVYISWQILSSYVNKIYKILLVYWNGFIFNIKNYDE